jgi:DNA polymerase (family 10)
MMDNNAIADNFALLSRLMEIHGEDSFRARSYASASFNIERLTQQLADTDRASIAGLKGIGASAAKKIIELLDTGKLSALETLIASTPSGIIEMMQIKGLGPKKISTIWKEMGIESIGELLYACQENRLLLFKGFGAKTQQNVMEAIEFHLRHQDQFLYAEIRDLAEASDRLLKERFASHRISFTGAYRRQAVVLDRIEWVTDIPRDKLTEFLKEDSGADITETDNRIIASSEGRIRLEFHLSDTADFTERLFATTGSQAFLEAWEGLPQKTGMKPGDEEAIFEAAGIHYIPACRREDMRILEEAGKGPLPETIIDEDIKGIIHSHSNWSDGSETIEEMAHACMKMGFEYLVISDHSRSAFYAGGLSVERIREQHAHIDLLNEKLKPFRIFKSIECDILNDGSMDYPDEVLATFDLVIASVHSNLKMTEEKAMMRLLKAIENPYTTILGHMTGRLLLSRAGYPVDHARIIDACAEHGVAIEINAHPRRLDIGWEWIPDAMHKGVMLAIDPDAHSTEGFHDIRYGVFAAQKGGLTKEYNLSSMGRDALEEHLRKRRMK